MLSKCVIVNENCVAPYGLEERTQSVNGKRLHGWMCWVQTAKDDTVKERCMETYEDEQGACIRVNRRQMSSLEDR